MSSTATPQQDEAPQREVAYDADAASRDRAKKAYVIDGVDYYPRKKTGRVVKEIIALGARIDRKAKDDDVEAQQTGIDVLYEQVAILLVNAGGENPDPERLMDVVDLDDAKEVIGRLFNNGKSPDEDEDTEGNPSD